MDHLPIVETPKPRRLLVLSTMLGTTVILTLVAVWQFLPLLAPQFVIRRSPWIWPIIRAEAYETEGRDPNRVTDPAKPTPERASLIDRLYEEEEWVPLAIPHLASALDHSDVRLRRTAAKTLILINGAGLGPSLVDLRKHVLTTRLLRQLDDPDPALFTNAFSLLRDTTDAAVAQAMLPYLPRVCGLTGNAKERELWFNWFGGAVKDEPHPMRFLRHASLVDAVLPWLESTDPRLQQLACVTLGFSNDPRALDLLIARLGRHLEADDPSAIRVLGVDDPVAYGLSESRDPRATAAINQALADPIAGRRLSAARAAHWRAAPESLAAFRSLIDDPEPAIRLEIARGLGFAFSLEETIAEVATIIARGGPPATEVISTVRFSLMRLRMATRTRTTKSFDSPQFTALQVMVSTRFVALLPTAEPAIRVSIIKYLGLMGDHDGDEVRRCLRSLADDVDPAVRAAVTTALDRIQQVIDRH